MRVGGDKIGGCGVEMGEVAAATAGDEDLFADAVCVLKHKYAPTAVTGMDGAEKSSCTCAEDNDIVMLRTGHGEIILQIPVYW
jgi:hypothetical protein